MFASRMVGLPVAVETDTPLSTRLSWQKRMAKRILYPPMLRIPSIFLPGGTRQKLYLQHYGVADNRIAIEMPADACVFLYVGRLEAVKGVAALLHAYSDMSARRDDVRLLVVGDG